MHELASGQSWEPRSNALAPMVLSAAAAVYWYDGDGSAQVLLQDDRWIVRRNCFAPGSTI